MLEDNLQWWAEHLPEPEAQLALLRAAKEHPRKFTNPDEIGMGWSEELRQRGYNALCPYARNYLAHRYLIAKGEHPEPRRVFVA